MSPDKAFPPSSSHLAMNLRFKQLNHDYRRLANGFFVYYYMHANSGYAKKYLATFTMDVLEPESVNLYLDKVPGFRLNC